MLESQKMLPSRQQAFCFFACLPEREHINELNGPETEAPFYSSSRNTHDFSRGIHAQDPQAGFKW
jgi:hypothetical protein